MTGSVDDPDQPGAVLLVKEGQEVFALCSLTGGFPSVNTRDLICTYENNTVAQLVTKDKRRATLMRQNTLACTCSATHESNCDTPIANATKTVRAACKF